MSARRLGLRSVIGVLGVAAVIASPTSCSVEVSTGGKQKPRWKHRKVWSAQVVDQPADTVLAQAGVGVRLEA